MLGKPSFLTRRSLEKSGRKATAEITWIADKGHAITHGNEAVVTNTEMILKTTLTVRPADEPEFEWTGKLRFPQLGVPGPGHKLAVLYDPEDHEKLMLDESEEAQINLIAEATGASAADIAAFNRDPEAAVDAIIARQGGSGWDQDTAAPAAAAEDPITQIERLGELKAKGLLSDAEFEQEKARILGR
jgi:hypothetical protein